MRGLLNERGFVAHSDGTRTLANERGQAIILAGLYKYTLVQDLVGRRVVIKRIHMRERIKRKDCRRVRYGMTCPEHRR